MKRFLIFGLLGPALGFVTFFWLLLQVMNALLGARAMFDIHQLVLLPLAYAFGIVPALLAALVDHVLARRHASRRILWTALFSYAAGFIPILSPAFAGEMHGPYLLLFGLIGAVPGAICSWLSGAAAAKPAASSP
jgi:hypothetical protein